MCSLDRRSGLTVTARIPVQAAPEKGLRNRTHSVLAQQTGFPSCPVTQTVVAVSPKDPNADPFGRGPWYINDNATIWVWLPTSGTWRVPGARVLWIRPAGTDLEIRGQRLDESAPPLEVEVPCCYTTGFQVTGMVFQVAAAGR